MSTGFEVSTRAHDHIRWIALRSCSSCHATVRAELSPSFVTTVKLGLLTSTQERSAAAGVEKTARVRPATKRAARGSFIVLTSPVSNESVRRSEHEKGQEPGGSPFFNRSRAF